jgi:hypothetical protein
MLRKQLWIVIGLILFLGTCGHAEDERPWAATLYAGRVTDGDLQNTAIFNVDLEDAYLVAATLSKRFFRYRDRLDLEWEVQVVKQFEAQDNWEFNGLGVVRWIAFPWDRHLDTSAAGGLGLSYATSIPKLEDERHDDTSQLLVYLMFELEFSLPRFPEWGLMTRIHHRSGAFGTFDGVHGASNAWVMGIRYHF